MPWPVGGPLNVSEFELTLSHRPIVSAEGQHVMALVDANQLGACNVGRGVGCVFEGDDCVIGSQGDQCGCGDVAKGEPCKVTFVTRWTVMS